MLFFYIIFLDFIKQKLGPIEKICSLDQNVGYMYRRFQLSICHSKRDIDVQKNKGGKCIFCILGFVTCISFYFYNIYTTVCD